MLDFAEKFTIDSSALSAATLQGLRDVGFSEKELLDIVLACGFRHWITRIADATGVELNNGLVDDDTIRATYSYERAASRNAADLTDIQRAVIDTRASGSGPTSNGPWITLTDDHELPVETRAVYQWWREHYGFLPGYFQAMSLHPRAVVTADSYCRGVIFGATDLGRRREDTIAVVVSTLLRCLSIAVLHGEMLRRRTGSLDPILEALHWRDATRNKSEKAILAFAEQMTLDCSQITQEWIEELRGHQISDEEILDVIIVTSYHNCFCRVANALGVPPDTTLAQDERLMEALVLP